MLRDAADIRTFSGLVEASFHCEDCGDEEDAYFGRNALGLAKQHAMRYGHTVRAYQTIAVTYAPPDSACALEVAKRQASRKGGGDA